MVIINRIQDVIREEEGESYQEGEQGEIHLYMQFNFLIWIQSSWNFFILSSPCHYKLSISCFKKKSGKSMCNEDLQKRDFLTLLVGI